MPEVTIDGLNQLSWPALRQTNYIGYFSLENSLLLHFINFIFVDKFLWIFQEELEALRAKFEKVDKERQELKQHNEKLDSRVSTWLLSFIFSIFHTLLWVNCKFLTVKAISSSGAIWLCTVSSLKYVP